MHKQPDVLLLNRLQEVHMHLVQHRDLHKLPYYHMHCSLDNHHHLYIQPRWLECLE